MTTRRRGPVEPVLHSLRRRAVASISTFTLALVVVSGAATPSTRVRATGALKTVVAVGSANAGWARSIRPTSATEMIGFTWKGTSPGTVSVRTHTSSGWGDWIAVEGNPAEGPDAGSREHHVITSAGPVWVGRGADQLDMRVDEGQLTDLRAIGVHADVTSSTGIPAASAAASQPAIHPRTDWGQPEEWQKNHDGCDAPEYASTVKYAVVHHTDNANTYTSADVPSLVNGIWRFHVFTNGWCDIGYNFLVDRFGGVWEGRAGGIASAVIGAHAGGYNARSTGVSLIGKFDGVNVPGAMYGALVQTLAWKMALHGANPTGQLTVTPAQYDQSRYPAGQPVLLWTVLGHRDVDSTDCPGGLAYELVRRLRLDVQKVMSGAQSPDSTNGYWLVASDGGIFAYGAAGFYGSTGNIRLNKPIVGMAASPSGRGYWLVASDGGIFAYGDAGFFGSTGSLRLNQPIVGMAATPSGKGYWLVASDGGIFAFGDAAFQGSMGSTRLNRPVVGMATDRSTGGYWLVASDGGIFAFNAPFYGSSGNIRLASPIAGMTATADGSGYQFVAGDGGVFSYGNARFAGSAAGGVAGAAVAAMAVDQREGGYRLVGGDGALFSFGPARFLGSPAHLSLARPLVGIASVPAVATPPPTSTPPGGPLPGGLPFP